MADRKLLVEIVSPERVLYASDADMIIAQTPEGEIGILPLHTPIVSVLDIGEVRVKHKDRIDYFFVDGGFVEVIEDKVIVLADNAQPVSEIEESEVKKTREEVEKAIKEAREKGENVEDLQKALKKSIVKLRVSKKASQS